jgi:CRP/FNR family transcriptional regulator
MQKEPIVFEKIVRQFLDDEDFHKIENSSIHLKFRKGEMILKQGNKPTHIAFLSQGIVKFNFMSELNEKNIILTIVSAPRILGGANLFYQDTNLFSIVAVNDCDVVLAESSLVLDLMRKNGNFAVSLFHIASDMFKQSILNFISVANKQKEGRIADVLLYLIEEIYLTPYFTLSLTRKELAEFACCSVENLIMTFSRWQQERIITVSGKQINVLEIDKLKHISKIG